MKHLLLTTLLTLLAAGAFAQKGNVTATIVDAETGNSVVGAVLTVAPTKSPEKKQGFASGYKGVASIPSLAYGEYALTVSFIGYNNLDTTFRLSTTPSVTVIPGIFFSSPSTSASFVTLNAPAL